VEQALQAAIAAFQRGARTESETLCRSLLAQGRGSFPVFTLLGIIAGESGRHAEARDLLARAAALNPGSAAAHFAHAKALKDSGDLPSALAAYDRSLSLDGNQAPAHNNRGNVLLELGRIEEARDAFARALEIDPSYAVALGNLGKSLLTLGKPEAAHEKCLASLALLPRQAAVEVTLGNALTALGKSDEALAAYDRAIEAEPSRAEAHNNRGVSLAALGRLAEATAAFERAVALNPQLVEAQVALADALHNLGRHEESLNRYAAMLSADPNNRQTRFNMGLVLRFIGDHAGALKLYDDALAMDPEDPIALENRGAALMSLLRHAQALETFAKLHRLDASYPFVTGHLLHMKALCCDWEQLKPLEAEAMVALGEGRKAVEPFGWQAIANDPQALQACARIYGAHYYPGCKTPLPPAKPSSGAIRVGYVSGEFRHQATSILFTEVLELHDKRRFEVVAFDNGHNDGSDMRRRIETSVNELVDISKLPDTQAAAAVRERGIDILVNLNGYFGLRRQELFAMRAAPIQVNYLGFPGTLGVDYMDYIVADATVIPPEDKRFYDEKVVWLPDCYQSNDRQRAISERLYTREELGLPPDGFVFCCFNTTYKIRPSIFDAWMRILGRVPGSTLWLFKTNDTATRNLRAEASRRGIDPGRIVFGPIMKLPEHLARLRAANLFLDTLPYNAHTTGSDALWAGLPVLTCMGRTFPSRVGASLLRAVGLPELVTENLADYEDLAVRLASDPSQLLALRERLHKNRLVMPLFDTPRFTRNLEQAYETMMERARSGLAPDHFAV
jgi:predicted O-linked N-acetylglucosamine transferase (SPINDLY family)